MIVLTGGGTGGHLYPGLAAAKALLAAGQNVTYVGAKGGLEERVLPDSGLPYRIIPAGKLSREALRPGEGFKVVQGLWQAQQTVRALRPKAILSMGGYAGFPAAFVGALMGIPMLIHEQNAKLGLANRILAKLAKRVLLSTPIALPSALEAKTAVMGYPVREQKADPTSAKAALGLDPQRPLLLVLGGSQGSKELNDHLPSRLQGILGSWQVLHQCGSRWEESLESHAQPHYHIRGYLDTTLAWSAAECAITRGGAGTMAESAYFGVPVLGVPLPSNLDDGAQKANVGFYAQQGAALLLEGWEAFPQKLEALLTPSTRSSMRDKLSGLSPEGAAQRLAKAVLEVCR